METTLTQLDGLLVEPEFPSNGVGILVVAGSSGRIDVERARLFARHGATALSIRWFGGRGQPPGICEIPLETFVVALDLLAATNDRLVIVGVSKGAEAALLVGAHDPRVNVVAAYAPSHVVWANVGPGRDGRSRPQRSSWTLAGVPLPFVPLDDAWQATDDPPAFRGLYESSLAKFASAVEAATIPVERIHGDVIVVAGEDDQVWASADHARAVARRRADHGMPTTIVTHPDAGHRAIMPGERPVTSGVDMARGGTAVADAALGQLAWQALCEAVPLLPSAV